MAINEIEIAGMTEDEFEVLKNKKGQIEKFTFIYDGEIEVSMCGTIIDVKPDQLIIDLEESNGPADIS